MAERTLVERVNAGARKRTRILADGETGLPLIVTEQDTKPILEANRRQANDFDKHRIRKNPGKLRHIASIPNVVVMQLQQRGIWGDEKAMLRWLSDPDNRAFRVDDGTRLA